ncbi:MAG: SurA N-terminal domain-containing protein, partial [candidate division NC10 bacterium]
MSRLAWTIILGAAAALLLVPGTAGAVTIERVVAVVNEEVITLSEVQEEGRAAAARLASAGEDPGLPDPAAPERRVLEELIERRLLLQEVSREGVRVEASE